MRSDVSKIIVKIVSETGVIPAYQTPGSAGCDLCSSEEVELQPLERKLVATGVRLEIPIGYECQVRPRSGLALKHGVTVFNSPGTCDSDFRGEYKVLMFNGSKEPYKINKGDRIAQMVFAKHEIAEFAVQNELSPSERGEGGWGHSGKN